MKMSKSTLDVATRRESSINQAIARVPTPTRRAWLIRRPSRASSDRCAAIGLDRLPHGRLIADNDLAINAPVHRQQRRRADFGRVRRSTRSPGE